MAEKFANLAETTLASGYTSGGSSISVSSASGFPADGVFRVRLGNVSKTIFRVDSVSGTTFTGAAEAFDGNASAADTVTLVATRGSMEQMSQIVTPGEARLLGGPSGGLFYGPTWELGDPTAPAWAWVNQGGAVAVEANGVAFLTIPNAATSIRARVVAAPSTPYQQAGLFRALQSGSSGSQYGGICFRESGTGKLYIFYVLNNGALQAVKFTNPTTFSAVGAVNTSLYGGPGSFHWLAIEDDGTDLHFLVSLDGVNYVEYGTEGRTVFMAGGPDQIGYFANVDSNGGGWSLSMMSWRALP